MDRRTNNMDLQFDPDLNKHFPFVYIIWPTIKHKHGKQKTTGQNWMNRNLINQWARGEGVAILIKI